MEADDPRIIPYGRVIPHTWTECQPKVIGPDGKINEPMNRKIIRIFRGLRADERIKFHQFTCHQQRTPVHLAVVEKINNKLHAAGSL